MFGRHDVDYDITGARGAIGTAGSGWWSCQIGWLAGVADWLVGASQVASNIKSWTEATVTFHPIFRRSWLVELVDEVVGIQIGWLELLIGES
jgi:hypothetical protein